MVLAEEVRGGYRFMAQSIGDVGARWALGVAGAVVAAFIIGICGFAVQSSITIQHMSDQLDTLQKQVVDLRQDVRDLQRGLNVHP